MPLKFRVTTVVEVDLVILEHTQKANTLDHQE